MTSNGLSVKESAADLFDNSYSTGEEIYSVPNSNVIYGICGQAFNPTDMAIVGEFNPNSKFYTSIAESLSFLPDIANHRVFALLYDVYGNDGSVTIQEYNSDTFLPIGAVTIPNVIDPSTNSFASDLVGWGSDGLAFRGDNGNVYLINGRTFPSLKSLTFDQASVSSGATVNETITLSSPAPSMGASVEFMNLIGNATGQVTIPAGQTSKIITYTEGPISTSDILTRHAVYGLQEVTGSYVEIDANSDQPFPPYCMEINQPNGDIAFNPANGLLYSTVPDQNAVNGNSIVSIDPNTGQISSDINIGSEPDSIAVSSDGSYVWGGLTGAFSIGRISLSNLTEDQFFYVGANTVDASTDIDGPLQVNTIAPVPGSPHSLIVSTESQNAGSTPGGYSDVEMYDDNIERPDIDYPFGIKPINLVVDSTGTTVFGVDLFNEFISSNISASGLSSNTTTAPVGPTFQQAATIRYDSGLIYEADGRIIDPTHISIVGTFPLANAATAVVPDVADGVVYFVELPSPDTQLVIEAFNPITLSLISTTSVPIEQEIPMQSVFIPYEHEPVLDAALCGPGKIAINTLDGQIFIVNTSQAPVLSPTTTLQPGLQMFSVPYDFSVGSQTLSQTFGGLTNPTLAVWQPGTNTYSVTPTPPASTLRVGQGYWARFPQAVNLTGPHVVTPPGPFGIALTAGWNMIGDPFDHPVSINAITVTTGSPATTAPLANSLGTVYPHFFDYTAGSTNYASYGLNDNLQPYLGYWVYAAQPCTINLQ